KGGGPVQRWAGHKGRLWVHARVPELLRGELVLHRPCVEMPGRPVGDQVLWVPGSYQVATEGNVEQGRVVEHQKNVGTAAVAYALARKLVVHLKAETVLPFGQLLAILSGRYPHQVVQVKVRLQIQIGQTLVDAPIKHNGQSPT